MTSLQNRYQRRTDVITQPLELRPNEQRSHSAPILIELYNPLLKVQLQDESGKLLADDQQQLTKTAQRLTVMLCGVTVNCRLAQSGLEAGGTVKEQAEKQQRLEFVQLNKPYDKWWKYYLADMVVIADAVPLTDEQRQAVEEFARQGGTVIDVSGKSSGVLSDYRSPEVPQSVSKGNLYRTVDFDNERLNQYLSGFGSSYYGSLGEARSYFLSRLGTSSTLPRLRWLLAWFALYIGVVGPLNFFILRKLKHLEFGWLTVPAIALVFALGFYWWGARNRPPNFAIDEVAIYWLDDRSNVASADLGVRVFSPERAEVTLSHSGEAILAGASDAGEHFDLGRIFGRREGTTVEGRRMSLGPPQTLAIEMARWSFASIDYLDIKKLPGTVRKQSENILLNETGKQFRDAVFLDHHGAVHVLGETRPGIIDLSSSLGISLKMLREKQARGEPIEEGDSILLKFLPSLPIESKLGNTRDLFIGLSEEPVLDAELKGVAFNRKNYAVTMVRIGNKQD